MIDGFWIGTVILLVMTCGVVYFRYAGRAIDSNWPLVYYAIVVVHLQMFPEGGLNQLLVLTSILAAMTLRFEFLTGWMITVIQGIEYICLVAIAFQLFNIVFIF